MDSEGLLERRLARLLALECKSSMPNIPLRTAQTDPTSPRTSSPSPNAAHFGGAAARGQFALGRDVEQFGGVIAGLTQKKIAAEEQIRKAKEDQDLRARSAEARLGLKESVFEAESAVPADAGLDTGTAPKKSLLESFQEIELKRVEKIRSGLSGKALDEFNQVYEIDYKLQELAVRDLMRRRDVDSARASLEKSEAAYVKLAADPTEDVDILIGRYHSDVDKSVSSGVWSQHQGEVIKRTTEDQMRKVNGAAKKSQIVSSAATYINGLDVSPEERVRLVQELPEEVRADVGRSVNAFNKAEAKAIQMAEEDAFDRAAIEIEFNGATPEDVGAQNMPSKYERSLRKLYRATIERPEKETREERLQKEKQAEEIWELRDSDPETFKRMNLRKMWDEIPASQRKPLMDEQRELREGKDPAKPPKLASRKMTAAMRIIDDTYEDKGMRGWAKSRIQEIAESRFADDPSRALSPAEERELAVEVVRELHGTGWMDYGKRPTRIIELTPSKAKEIVQFDLADQDQTLIDIARERLKKQGRSARSITPDMVETEIFTYMIEMGLLDEEGNETRGSAYRMPN